MLPEAARIAAGIVAAAATLFSVVYMAWLSGQALDTHPSLADFSVAQRSARNTAILFGSGIAERALFWGFWIVALRILGPTGNGEYAFATNLFVYFAAVTNFGLSTLVSREVARRREDLLTIFGNALVLRLLVLLAGAPVMVLLAVAYRVGDSISDVTVAVTILIAISLIPSSINQAYAAVYAGFERADFRGAVAIGTALFTVGAGVLALLTGAGLIGLGAVAIVAGVLTFATLARPLGYRLLGTYKLAARRELGEMARSATPLMLNELLANVFFQIDILVIQSLQGTEMVGKYNASYKFIAALTVIPVAVALPLFPALVRAAVEPGRAWTVVRASVEIPRTHRTAHCGCFHSVRGRHSTQLLGRAVSTGRLATCCGFSFGFCRLLCLMPCFSRCSFQSISFALSRPRSLRRPR